MRNKLVKCWSTGDDIKMTSDFSKVLLALYTRVLQNAQQSTGKKKQSEHNEARSKAVLLFGFTNFCLMFVENNHRLITNKWSHHMF